MASAPPRAVDGAIEAELAWPALHGQLIVVTRRRSKILQQDRILMFIHYWAHVVIRYLPRTR